MADGRHRRLDRAFKVAALARMAAGENVSALSRELGVRRKLLYQWRDRVRRGGVEALRGVGRPRAGARPGAVVGRSAAPPAGVAAPDALAQARHFPIFRQFILSSNANFGESREVSPSASWLAMAQTDRLAKVGA